MKRVVILGSTGFTGTALAKKLGANRTPILGLGSKQLDLTEASSSTFLNQSVQDGDALVFISALTPDRGRDVNTLIANLRMAENVAKHLEASRAGYFLYLSSDAVYGDGVSYIQKSTPAEPGSFHGVMHFTRELILKAALSKRKIPFGIVRSSVVYGPGDTHRSYGPNRFAQTAQAEGKITLFGEGEEKRDHLFIQDLANLMMRSLQAKFSGTINAASGSSTTFREVAEITATQLQASGKSVKVEATPRANPITHRHFDLAPLLNVFPDFRFTPLSEGLRSTLHSLTTSD